MDDGLEMSITEIKLNMLHHNDRLRSRLWWLLMPSSSVVIPWPMGWTEIDHLGNQIESNDPEDHWGRWLRAHVGRKGWDWDWNLATIQSGHSHVEIRFRREMHRTAFALRWMQ